MPTKLLAGPKSKRISFKNSVVISCVTLMSAIAFTPPAQASIVITKPASNLVIPESNDFASQRFVDPWDMSSPEDASHGQYSQGISHMRWARGMLSGRGSNGAYFHPLFPGWEGTIPNGRDGLINKINTNKYGGFAVRMYSSRKSFSGLMWYYNQFWTDIGTSGGIPIEPGWHTYVFDLASNSQWNRRPIGLRFDIDSRNFKIDWMRLYQPTGRRVTIAWTDNATDGATHIYLDRDKNPANGNSEKLATLPKGSAKEFSWDPSPYQPGVYYFQIKKADEISAYSRRVVINRAPLIAISDPDATGGEDYATAVSGDPWDMSQPSDVRLLYDITDAHFSDGILSATTANSDGYLNFRVPAAIDTQKYYRLSFRFGYDGPFDFGLGSMSRIIWTPNPRDPNGFQTSGDLVTYPNWQTYVLDLRSMKTVGGTIGWNGPMKDFRFDPVELPGRTRFYLDFVRLAADDSADRSFNIKWSDARKKHRPTRVSLFYDKDRRGFNGRVIAKNINQVSGLNNYTWDTAAVPSGNYYIYLVANDGISTTKVYSSGPVRINH